jgi:hypothetical protein
MAKDGSLKDRGVAFGMKALSKLMEDPDRAEKLMKAMQTVQQGREKVDDAAAALLNLGQLPAASDLKELSRQAGRLKREGKRVLSLLDDLEQKLEKKLDEKS